MLDLITYKVCEIAFSDRHLHDFTIFKESIRQSLTELMLVLVDLGYLGILKFHENTIIGDKNLKNSRVIDDDKHLNKVISVIRIDIEHFNSRFKSIEMISVPDC